VNTFTCDEQNPCTDYQYGLSAPDSYEKISDPSNPLKFRLDQFGGSLTYSRGTGVTAVAPCGAERDYTALYGKVVFREQDNCDWTDTVTNPDGCPVELAVLDEAGQDARGEKVFFASSRVIYIPNLIAVSTAINGGLAGFGVRQPLPGGGSKVTMSEITNGGGDSDGCCQTLTGGPSICEPPAGQFDEYPILTKLAGNEFTTTNLAPLIFEGGPGTPFAMDEDFEVAGQEHGVCRVNRFIPCTLSGLGTVCPGFDATPEDGVQQPGEPGFVPDACDFRELGWRFQPFDVLADGSQNTQRCNQAPFLFRGFPEQNCSLAEDYILDGPLGDNGDPGGDCAIRNYGKYVRPDLDCNGVDDTDEGASPTGDLCPLYSEVNPFADADGNGRGDECDCGDATADGTVDVSDILGINFQIFNPAALPTRLTNPLADANNDLQLDSNANVEDILAVNEEIFSPGLTSTCATACNGFPGGERIAEQDIICDIDLP
jgi:hypothetical protein